MNMPNNPFEHAVARDIRQWKHIRAANPDKLPIYGETDHDVMVLNGFNYCVAVSDWKRGLEFLTKCHQGAESDIVQWGRYYFFKSRLDAALFRLAVPDEHTTQFHVIYDREMHLEYLRECAMIAKS